MSRKPGRKDHPGIPRSKIRIGIAQCLSVASLRLEETDTLVEKGLLTSAGIIFSFAVEEYGKAVLLRNAFLGGSDPAPVEGFYDHTDKLKAAATQIPAKYRRLIESAFELRIYGASGIYGGGKPVDLNDRLSALYVDWKGGRWVCGVPVNPTVLKQSSEGVRLAIQRAMVKWTSVDG